jgi:hypothetical protein
VSAADAGEIFGGPGHLQGGEVEELHGRNVLVDGFGTELALIEEMKVGIGGRPPDKAVRGFLPKYLAKPATWWM